MGNTCRKKSERSNSDFEFKAPSPEKNIAQKIENEKNDTKKPNKPKKIFKNTELMIVEKDILTYMNKRKSHIPEELILENNITNKNERLSQSFTSQKLEALGVPLFDQNEYENLIEIGEETMINESLANLKFTGETVLVKSLKLLPANPKTSQEIQELYVQAFFIEKYIMDYIAKENSPHVSRLKTLQYSLKHEKDIKNLYIISSVGACSLSQLILERKKLKEPNPPYELNEALKIIRATIKSLKFLQQNRIYHSDIIPDNIFVNLRQKKYQISGFYVSWVLPPDSNKIDARDYAIAGTPDFFSPEKKFFWNALLEGKIFLDHENKSFNPYKDDIYSLGICFSLMIGGEEKASGKAKELLQKMLTSDWENRPDATELEKFIDANFDKKLFNSELNSLDVDIANKLIEAGDYKDKFMGLTQEMASYNIRIEYLQNQLCKWEAKSQDERKLDEEEHAAWIHYHLAYVMNEAQYYDQALENIEEAISIWKRIHLGGLDGYYAASCGIKGHILANMGLYEKAKKLFEEQLTIERNLHETDEWSDIAATMSCVAAMTSRFGEHEKALEIYKRVYEIQTNLFNTEEIEEVADTVSNIAYEMGRIGEIQSSIDENKKAIALRKKIYGTEDHIKIATNLESIANKWSSLGDHKRALKEHNEILQLRKKIYKNDENLDIATSLRNIAQELNFLGEKAEAVKHMEKAYEIRKKIYKDNDHPCLERTKYLLDKIKFEK